MIEIHQKAIYIVFFSKLSDHNSSLSQVEYFLLEINKNHHQLMTLILSNDTETIYYLFFFILFLFYAIKNAQQRNTITVSTIQNIIDTLHMGPVAEDNCNKHLDQYYLHSILHFASVVLDGFHLVKVVYYSDYLDQK